MYCLPLGVEYMTLFSLAKKNIKGNFSSYLVYFISLVFSMVIYFTFVSLQYSEKIQENILLSDTMNFMFMAASFVLIVFAAVFILYSNSFFMRKRKKEVGLYSMLGLKKKTIGRLLFYENLIMGILALAVGILFGTILSKLFSMILIHLMGSTSEIDFGMSIEAIAQTAIVFMVIILFTSIQGYRLIYRFKLIELFNAAKKGEQIPKSSLLSSTIGILLLVISYWLILRPFPEELTNEYIQLNYGTALIILILGTHLFFRFVTVSLLKMTQKNKSYYYKGTNLIETAQLIFRLKGNARTFTLIAILSAATISFFGATYGGYYGNERQAKEDVPFSYSHLSHGDTFDKKVEAIVKEDRNHPVVAQLTIPVVEAKGKLSFNLDYLTDPMKIISEETFNSVSSALDREDTVSLSGNEAAVIKPRLTKFTDHDFQGETIALEPDFGGMLKMVDMVEGHVLPFEFPDFFIVVSNGKFKQLSSVSTPLVYKAYEVVDEQTTAKTSKELSILVGEDFQVSPTYYLEYKEGKEGNALNLFIMGFLGLVFLAATGSIIYFKQLTEANEVKSEYEILRKIGVGKKELSKSIQKQTLFIFGLPLLVGLVHGAAILHFTSNFLSNLIGAKMFVPMLTATLAFIGIYFLYYVLTVKTYNSIVNK
jgi:putative ABC transport system permease protein